LNAESVSACNVTSRLCHYISSKRYDVQIVFADDAMPSASVRDLGIFIDDDVSMWTHVAKTVSSCFAFLCHLCSIS